MGKREEGGGRDRPRGREGRDKRVRQKWESGEKTREETDREDERERLRVREKWERGEKAREETDRERRRGKD